MPAGSRDVRAGGAYIELGIRDKLQKGLQRAAGRLRSFGASVTAIGASIAGFGSAALTPLLAAAQQFAKTGSELKKISVQTGESVENLSALKYAASQTGVEFDDLVGAIEESNIRMGEAARDGTGALHDTLVGLGVDFDRLNKLNPADRFKALASILQKIDDPSLRGFLADELFGGDAFKVLPLLRSDISALTGEAERLGVVMSDEAATDASKLNKMIGTLKAQFMGMVNTIGAAVAPTLIEVAGYVSDVVMVVAKWIKENQQLFAWALKIAAVIVAVGLGLVAFGTVAGVVAFAISGISAAIGVLVVIVKGLIAVLAFLVSPVGLVIVAIVAAAAALLYFSGVGAKVIGFLQEQFGRLLKWAKHVFGGIAAALKTGDMQAAAKILWLALQVIWQKGIGKLQGLWMGFKNFVLRVFDEVRFGLVKIFAAIVEKVGQLARRAGELAGIDSLKEIGGDIEGFGKEVGGGAQNAIDQNAEKRQKETDRATSAAEANLKAAQAELDAAIALAKDKAAEADRKKQEQVPNGPDFDFSGLGGGKDLKNSIRGTFSGAAAARFGAISLPMAKRTAVATERTAKATEESADLLKKLKAPAFG